MTARLLLLALALTGCSEPVPLHVVGPTEHIDEACDLLGIACVSSKRDYGSIELRVISPEGMCDPDDKHVLGYMDDSRCTPRGCAENDPILIAHEIAHALELEHTDRAGNLMTIDAEGIDLVDEQLDTLIEGATQLVNCR